MTWLRKARPVLIAVGLALGIGALIGARTLTGASNSEAGPKAGEGARANGGPVVLGLVDTDPPPVSYGLPPVLQSGTVAKVHVKDGDEVKVDQVLYEFDATMQKRDVKQAETAVASANTKVKEAEEGVKQHAEAVKSAQLTVELAENKASLTAEYYRLVEKGVETFYRTEMIPEKDWPERKKSDSTLYKAKVDYTAAVNEVTVAKARRDQLKAADPTVKVEEAKAAVEQAKAQLDKAQSAVDLCVVKALTAGTVEQVSISPGTTLGISTRAPALWLIPAGPRVVRAEVEAEFAHRVGTDRIGREVTIYDHSDPKLTYTGVVRRVGTTFLLKRANAENFLGGDTRVIEVVVEVTEAAPEAWGGAPTGGKSPKPPLRVGQRVRVNLGQ